MDGFARRLASLDKQALSGSKALVNRHTVPDPKHQVDSGRVFLSAFAWAGFRERAPKLAANGLGPSSNSILVSVSAISDSTTGESAFAKSVSVQPSRGLAPSELVTHPGRREGNEWVSSQREFLVLLRKPVSVPPAPCAFWRHQ